MEIDPTPDEPICDAARRKIEDDACLEQKIIAAEQTELSPLTKEDLQSVRRLARQT